mgnify:FL=1
MKTRIEILENAAKNSTRYADLGINPTFGAAYFFSLEAGNDLINFGEVIWDHDIDPILADCQKFGIKEFTISSTFSSLITTIALLEEKGCKLEGLVKIKSRYTDFRTGEKESIPAFKMSIGE